MKKKAASVLLILTLLFSLLPLSALAAEGGPCGASARWTLEGDTLTISGTGAMYDYTYSADFFSQTVTTNLPWFEYRDQVKRIVVSEGITRLGDYAFRDLAATSIQLPNSLTEIGAYALVCPLDSLTLPKQLRTLGRFSIYGTNIQKLVVPGSVREIAEMAIVANPELEVVVFEEGVTSIPEMQFSTSFRLLAVEVPVSAKSVLSSSPIQTDIYYRGTEAQWQSVQLSEDLEWRVGNQITVHYGDAMAQFTDVRNDWTYEGIRFCVENGYMNGMDNGIFQPSGVTTRAQLVTILWRMSGEPAATETMPFDDCGISWADPAIAWAAENGIVDGVAEGKFAPNTPITREQLVTIFYRFLKDYVKHQIEPSEPVGVFPDAAKVSDWAKEAMEWGTTVKLITGVGTDHGAELQPQGQATRAQIARVIMNFFNSYVSLKWDGIHV